MTARSLSGRAPRSRICGAAVRVRLQPLARYRERLLSIGEIPDAVGFARTVAIRCAVAAVVLKLARVISTVPVAVDAAAAAVPTLLPDECSTADNARARKRFRLRRTYQYSTDVLAVKAVEPPPGKGAMRRMETESANCHGNRSSEAGRQPHHQTRPRLPLHQLSSHTSTGQLSTKRTKPTISQRSTDSRDRSRTRSVCRLLRRAFRDGFGETPRRSAILVSRRDESRCQPYLRTDKDTHPAWCYSRVMVSELGQIAW